MGGRHRGGALAVYHAVHRAAHQIAGSWCQQQLTFILCHPYQAHFLPLATILGSDLLRTAFIRADSSLKLNGFVI